MRTLAAAALALLACVFAPAADAQSAAETRYAQRLAELVNEYRVRQGLGKLALDATLSGLAREHSVAMGKTKRLSHDEFPARVGRSGRAMCIENVGWNYRAAEDQFDAWRASPGHDRNLKDSRVDRMGIGVAADYVTLIACQ